MRPEILFPLFAPVSSLTGVGPRVAPLLAKAAGPLVRDVLFLLPASLQRRRRCQIASAQDGELVLLEVTIEAHAKPGGARQPWKIRAFDGTGFVTLVFFKGYGGHLEKSHPVGVPRLVSGKLERFGSEIQIAHPDYLADPGRSDTIPEIEPIYPATAGLSSRMIRRFVQEALKRTPDLPEWQDAAWLARQGWPGWRQALEQVHAPASEADLDPQAPARQRLAFDEFLAHQLALAQRRNSFSREAAPVIRHSGLARQIEAALDFRLTGDQQRALSEIGGDLASGSRMSRLLQGDVGSGKTVVAQMAMADVAASGRQSAVLAPTEILARQHFATLAPGLEAADVGVVLLTGRDKGKARAAKLESIVSGEAGVVVGTHALFQDDVAYRALSLCIIDEQHRFGVNDRQRLMAKGEAVHMLAMSATPIPRTLELTQYGDLDVSRIREKPPGRTPVLTRTLPNERIDDVLARLVAASDAGAQAFWICPLVAESDVLDVTAAEQRALRLQDLLPGRIGLVHGQMPGPERDRVMEIFAEGGLSVLVATTVVEVGVNVPNATIMVIEHAERFGLAQLHQLRGRVGRGAKASACLLLYQSPLGATARARLDALRNSDDGFELAEKDLELRGGGDPLGLRQSGFPAYRHADVLAHRHLLLAASDDARLVLNRDPDMTAQRGQRLQTLQHLFDWRQSAPLNDAG